MLEVSKKKHELKKKKNANHCAMFVSHGSDNSLIFRLFFNP